MRITVFGTGYLGATHAACMAELGHDVLGVDVDESKLRKLEAGEVPFWEPGLEEILQRNIAAGRLRFTSSYIEAAEFAEVHFLGVGTPQTKGEYAADMKYVDAVIETLAPLADKASCDLRKVHSTRRHRRTARRKSSGAGTSRRWCRGGMES